MKVVVDLCVIPLGSGASVSEQVIDCERILSEFDVKTYLHAFGTNIEGKWDEVFAAIKACHSRLHDQGVVRISTTIKVDTRTDKDPSIDHKINAVKKVSQATNP